MEYRKIISFGKGGYVISMPKDWVEANRLKKGSVVVLEKNGDALTLLPPKNGNASIQQTEEHEFSIYVDDKPFDVVVQMLTSAYLNSYSTIYIIGEKLSEILPDLKEYINKLVALEILESSRTKLVLKDFIDFNSIVISEHLRKMDMIIRSVFLDILANKPELYGSIIARDNDVDRLFFIINKAMRKAVNDPSALKSMKISCSELLKHFQNSQSLEHLGDTLQKFTKHLKNMSLKDGERKELFSLLEKLYQTYLDTMKAFYKKDTRLAFSLASKKKEMLTKITHMQQKYPKPVPLMLETLARIPKINHAIMRTIGEQ